MLRQRYIIIDHWDLPGQIILPSKNRNSFSKNVNSLVLFCKFVQNFNIIKVKYFKKSVQIHIKYYNTTALKIKVILYEDIVHICQTK